MRVGTVLMGVGFMLFSQMSTATEFFGFYFLMSLGSSLGGFLSMCCVGWGLFRYSQGITIRRR